MEESFEITALVGGSQCLIDVYPENKNGVDYFTIDLGGVHLGVLAMSEEGFWKWDDSALSQEDAENIGTQIDNHYK